MRFTHVSMHEYKTTGGDKVLSVIPRIACWCNTHQDLAWEYDDGGITCIWDLITENSSDDHDIVHLDVIASPVPKSIIKGMTV